MKKFVLSWLAFTQAISLLGAVVVVRFTLRLFGGEETSGQPFLMPSFAAFLALVFLVTVAALCAAAWRQFARGEENAAIALSSLPLLLTLPAIAVAFVRFMAVR